MLDEIKKEELLFYVIVLLITLLVIIVLIRINKAVFEKLQTKKHYLHFVFFERLVSIVIVLFSCVIGFSFFSGIDNLWRSLLGGTAVISAVIIFAAQDIVKDILAGLMLSIYRPFEIGNRITLEDGNSGVVRDITMRHVVVHTWGSQELIIPNSKLNTMSIINDSYHEDYKAFQISFHISYTSDVEKAIEVVKKEVMESEYTVPGQLINDSRQYCDVYFMQYEDSSFLLSTTVYYYDYPTEVVRSDINRRVNKAFKENGIEIPYPYINIVQK